MRPGGHILVDDGLVDLEVQDISGKDIVCKVINAGVIGDKMCIRDRSTSVPILYSTSFSP